MQTRETWALQDAKNRFSQVVEQTLHHGPQTITRRGIPVVVVLPYAEYQQSQRHQDTLVDFLRNSPLAEVEIAFERITTPARELEL